MCPGNSTLCPPPTTQPTTSPISCTPLAGGTGQCDASGNCVPTVNAPAPAPATTSTTGSSSTTATSGTTANSNLVNANTTEPASFPGYAIFLIIFFGIILGLVIFGVIWRVALKREFPNPFEKSSSKVTVQVVEEAE